MKLAVTLMLGCSLRAQTPDPQERIQALEKQLAVQRRLINDFGGLNHYGSDNTELRPVAAGENRVVFIGDQITELWGAGKFFPGRPYLNRGIAGQTSSQMLVRFRQDVVALKPKVVVILAGTNDVAGFRGPATEEMIADNIMSMTELAHAHGIHAVLASVPPVCDCFTKPTVRQRWEERIVETNQLIKQYAAESNSVYLDYYSALADSGELKKALTSDGILPNDAGYQVMGTLAEKAIAAALAKKGGQ
jgi:lysophospholipase L1-like esterase